jgi:hypothetical protein
MADERFAMANVVACFSDINTAAEAIAFLERGGIDSARISLLGRDPEELATLEHTQLADDRETKHVARNAVLGTAAGAAIGGVTGFLSGLAAFAIPGVGPVVGTGVWIATFSGAAFGAGLGGNIAGVAALPVSDGWDLAQHVRKGGALVGVHSDDQDEVNRATEILKDLHPARIGEFDAEGRPLRANPG